MDNTSHLPYSYRAFGLNILSEIAVSAFKPAPPAPPDVTIRKGDVPSELPGVINKGVLYQSSATGFILNIDSVASYYAREGSEITVRPCENADDRQVSAFLNGTVFGAIIHQRKLLPLHASTVIYRQQCLVFAGLSGAGKSTMAASLINKGATLVADDISVVDCSGNRPLVYPAYPAIKLWEDSLLHLGFAHEKLLPVRELLRKYYQPVERFEGEPSAIDRIIILNSHNLPGFQRRELTGVDKFIMLKKHTYLFRGIPKTSLQENHFTLVSRMAASIPVHILTRPNSGFDIKSMILEIDDLIKDDQNR